MTAQDEICALLQAFQDGYFRRDVTQVDSFMELFTADTEVIGTNGIKPGVDEWFLDRASARELLWRGIGRAGVTCVPTWTRCPFTAAQMWVGWLRLLR
jgi:hypothetical protein